MGVDGSAVFQSAATLLALALLLPAHLAQSVRFWERGPAVKATLAGISFLAAMIVSFFNPLAGALLIVEGVLLIALLLYSDMKPDPMDVEAGEEVVMESLADKTLRIAEDFGRIDRGY